MKKYIIISIAARALAESASRAGYDVGIIDCFVDSDTLLFSNLSYQTEYNETGFVETSLLATVQHALTKSPNATLVLGSGFEFCPELINKLKALAPTIANTKKTIEQLKQPLRFCALLKKNRIKHPHTQLRKPTKCDGYLIKRVAAHGGTHVNWLENLKPNNDTEYYYQQFIAGEVFSVLFLANGKQATIIGYNRQIQSNEFKEMPFLFKGAIRLNKNEIKYSKRMERYINAIVNDSSLSGLCGLDYILDKNGEIIVLEVNPRPPATFELHEDTGSLFDAHLAAFNNGLIGFNGIKTETELYKGYAILYAKEDLHFRREIEWSEWTKDKPSLNRTIQAKSPICTVHAEENSLDKINAILFNRLTEVEMQIVAANKL